MKVTVCELSENDHDFSNDWEGLKIHLDEHKPDLLLLPELPFSSWIAAEKTVDVLSKIQSWEKHERWMSEMEQLSAKYIVYSKPVINGDNFFNTAFVYENGMRHRKIHTKSFFPEEPHFWEESWYTAEEGKPFEALELDGFKIGVLLCTEMWFTRYARQYGNLGVDILLCPRATGMGSTPQWTRCGQTLGVISGAYCLSSNKSGLGNNDFQWGGNGFIAGPMDGELLGNTSFTEKFVTREIDLNQSRIAKKNYPLYVKE